MASARTSNPQTFNSYSYTLNNPLRYVDPTGLGDQDPPDYTPEIKPCDLGAKGCSANNVLAGVTINISEPIETRPIDVTPTLDLQKQDPDEGNPNRYDQHYAHDNDDFRQINVSFSPRPLVVVGVHFAFTWDKYGRHYFSVGPTIGLGLPVSASLLTGQTYLGDQQVRDEANVENILTGPSAGFNVCPVVCGNTSWNITKPAFWGVSPPWPTGGSTIAMGLGTPEVSVGKDWAWRLWF
jgi:hypothetical protein